MRPHRERQIKRDRFGEKDKRKRKIKSKWDGKKREEETERGVRGGETDLEKLKSFCLQSFRGQSGERRTQTLLTEAQGLTLPQGRFWENEKKVHTQTHANTHMHVQRNTEIEFQSCNDTTADKYSHTLSQL